MRYLCSFSGQNTVTSFFDVIIVIIIIVEAHALFCIVHIKTGYQLFLYDAGKNSADVDEPNRVEAAHCSLRSPCNITNL